MQRLLATIVLVSLVWATGFLWFISSLPHGAPAPTTADSVVVLTGAGGERIPTAMSLIGKGAGKRLLISGVNPKTSREQMAALWPGDASGFDCCVDLGMKATTTQENAEEVRIWASDHNFDRILLVTSDYHMPRAMLELRDASPDALFIAYPVASVFLDNEGRPASPDAWRILAKEYTKYLAVRVKTLVT